MYQDAKHEQYLEEVLFLVHVTMCQGVAEKLLQHARLVNSLISEQDRCDSHCENDRLLGILNKHIKDFAASSQTSSLPMPASYSLAPNDQAIEDSSGMKTP
jgi:hypothetical protein